jgi:hypothetical protein
MIPFTKPGQSEDWDVMAEKGVRIALQDAGVSPAERRCRKEPAVAAEGRAAGLA